MALTEAQRDAIIECLDELLVNYRADLDGCSIADLFAAKVEKCNTAHQTRRLGFGGQIFYSGPSFNQVLGWSAVPATISAPCDGFASIHGSLPWIRTLVRDSFLQAYVDFRMTVNGNPVGTQFTANTLVEENERDATPDNALHYDMHNSAFDGCVPVLEGDIVGYEWRIRGRQIQINGTSPYTRLMVYRRNLNVSFTPEEIVTEVTHA